MSEFDEHIEYILWKFPTTNPASAPGGWYMCGDIYMYRFKAFSNSGVETIPLLILIDMSKKLTLVEGRLKVQVTPW